MSDFTTTAKQLIEDNKYLMISKSWCPDCHYAYKIWDDYNVKSKIRIIELDKYEDQAEAANLQKAFAAIVGRSWVPTIFFNGQSFDENDLKNWKAKGELDTFFKKHGLIN